ncbi:MAG TPA: type VI secretion system-associated protein TagF [Nevskiaceae bacterium]
MNGEPTVDVSYFGKLPGADDFLQSAGDHRAVIAPLDRWAQSALEMLARDATWEQLYDRAPPLDFALLGSRRRGVVAGHLAPSMDASGRRFPFIAAISTKVPRPLEFLSRSPLAFARTWAHLEHITREARRGRNPAVQLQRLSDTPAQIHVRRESLDATFQGLLETQTVGSLQALLDAPGRPSGVRRILIALGVLLQPMMGTAPVGLAQGLALPLPCDPLYRNPVSCLWLDLIAGFLARVDCELLLLRRTDEPALLTVSFGGLQGGDLRAMFDPTTLYERYVPVHDPAWADKHVATDAGLRKLATYTDNEGLSLHTARRTFRETFLGA